MHQTQPNFNRPIHETKTKDVVFDQSQIKNSFQNQIHKTPQSIRKSIKIGKHRKHARIISKYEKQKPIQYFKDYAFQNQIEKQKLAIQINARQIFNFQTFNAQDQQTRKSLKQFNQKKYLLQNGVKQLFLTNDKMNGTDRALNIRKKLSPLKKGISTEDKINKNIKKVLKITFLNIQKAPLINLYDQLKDKQQQVQETLSGKNYKQGKYSLDFGFQSIVNKKYFDKKQKNFQSETTGFSSLKKRISISEDIGFNSTTLKFKKFKAPFERYFYRDFLWKCAFSNGLKLECQKQYQKKFKIFIGKGNNSLLIKSLFKKRNWWTITDKYEQANLVWTQIKISDIFKRQISHQVHQKKQQYFNNTLPNANASYKKKSNYQFNKKIMNQYDLQRFYQYFNKHQRIQQKLDQTMAKRNKLLKKQYLKIVDLKKVRIHNHLPNNYIIGNKKALYYTMNSYYEKTGEDIFTYLPLTFHIQNGLQDDQYSKFLSKFYQKQKSARKDQRSCSPEKQKTRNIWIVKPGQFTNRGNGINVCMNLDQIKAILKKKEKHDNGNLKTYIIQSYLDKPFLYQKRKFDIRHYMMITSFNGRLKGYWCDLGYIRTTSSQYTVKNGLSSIHLTNDAVQKYLPEYGKYQKGNKLSYDMFQRYLDKQYPSRYNFMEDIYPMMKKIATDSIKACALVIDPDRKDYNFQVFGLDFMVDQNFKPWLIQINNNPCLQLSCPILGQLIPEMVQNCFKLCVDSIVPPPANFQQKRPHFNDDCIQRNHFQIVYDSVTEQQVLKRLFSGQKNEIRTLKQFDEDDQIFEDDGDEIQD